MVGPPQVTEEVKDLAVAKVAEGLVSNPVVAPRPSGGEDDSPVADSFLLDREGTLDLVDDRIIFGYIPVALMRSEEPER